MVSDRREGMKRRMTSQRSRPADRSSRKQEHNKRAMDATTTQSTYLGRQDHASQLNAQWPFGHNWRRSDDNFFRKHFLPLWEQRGHESDSAASC